MKQRLRKKKNIGEFAEVDPSAPQNVEQVDLAESDIATSVETSEKLKTPVAKNAGGKRMLGRGPQDDLVKMIGGKETPTAEQFKQLIMNIDSHSVLAKVFLLEGVPHVFAESPMKYVIFREQVADRFGVGSQDVCIVGSAKLGYSCSFVKYGTPFRETSDVDVVIISEPLFLEGSHTLFTVLNKVGPPLNEVRRYLFGGSNSGTERPTVDLAVWRTMKEAVRNFVFGNFNPGLLPNDHPTRIQIFSKISGTAGLFLALEPRVFVSKIRCRVFRNWKAAEDYYANGLREARNSFNGKEVPEVELEEGEEDLIPGGVASSLPTNRDQQPYVSPNQRPQADA